MNNIHKTFRAGLALAAGLVAMYSCTDTWDDHYGESAVNTSSYAGTLMQALEEQAPDFAKVVKAYGYDRELASDNFYTVWAPVDGSFQLSDYIDENGNRVADSTEVVKFFLKSHIARFAFSLGKEDQSVSLLNEKLVEMKADGEFGNSQLLKKNISTHNGVLYTISAVNPYSYNLFEMIEKQYKSDQTEGKETNSLYAYLYDNKYNKDSLIEDKSVYRGYDENGNKIWVDSFLLRNNTVLKNIRSEIYEEDSSFIAILPSAKAWQERYNIAKSLLKFNPSEDERTPGACDSLQRHYANNFAMTDLFYNKTNNEHWQDSLVSTNYGSSSWWNNKYYAKMPKFLHPDREINDILAKSGEPYVCSNGDAYLVDEYPMSVTEQFFRPRYISLGRGIINLDLDKNGKTMFTKNVNESFSTNLGTFTTTVLDTITGETYTSERESYRYLRVEPSTGTANPIVAFNISNSLSGVYDIFLVTCPIWLDSYNTSSSTDVLDLRPYRFYVNVIERNDKGVYPTSGERLKNPADGSNYFVTSSQVFKDTTDISKGVLVNDTLYIGSYDFKNSYYGRNEAGALIQIQSQISSKLTKEYSRKMLLSTLILRPRGYHSGEGDDKIILLPTAYKGSDSENKPKNGGYSKKYKVTIKKDK